MLLSPSHNKPSNFNFNSDSERLATTLPYLVQNGGMSVSLLEGAHRDCRLSFITTSG